jgi:hypothetical protein
MEDAPHWVTRVKVPKVSCVWEIRSREDAAGD